VDDPPELEVCGTKPLEPLARLGRWGIELCSRSSSGRSGIGRSEDPRQLLGGLPVRALRWPGDGVVGIGHVGRIDRERHQYRSPAFGRATDSFRGTIDHHPKGPCCSYQRGPFTYFRAFPPGRPGAGPVDGWRKPSPRAEFLSGTPCGTGLVWHRTVIGVVENHGTRVRGTRPHHSKGPRRSYR